MVKPKYFSFLWIGSILLLNIWLGESDNYLIAKYCQCLFSLGCCIGVRVRIINLISQQNSQHWFDCPDLWSVLSFQNISLWCRVCVDFCSWSFASLSHLLHHLCMMLVKCFTNRDYVVCREWLLSSEKMYNVLWKAG